jgi:transcription antitermination factor NusB
LLKGVCKNKEYLDKLIRQSSKNWRIERMSVVDRSIIRLSAYEILFMEDIPSKVSIDEAVELGKKFGTDESKAFINGILDNIFERWCTV